MRLEALVQAHARKNHSYFLVFYKPQGKERWKGLQHRHIVATPSGVSNSGEGHEICAG
jgi:hypothetical protein